MATTQNSSNDLYNMDDGESSADAVRAVMRFVRIVYHRIWYVVATVGIVCLLGALYYNTATPIYEAKAQLLVLQTGSDVLSNNTSPEAGRQAMIPTYERLFSSTTVLEGAVSRLQKAPPQMRVDFVGVPREDWVRVLRSQISARAARRTNVIELACRSKSPEAAETLVRAIVDSYLEFMERNHKDVSAEIATLLNQERSKILGQLRSRELELLEIRQRVGDLGLDEKQNMVHPDVQRVIRLNESLVAVQQERIKVEAVLATVREGVRQGADLRQHLSAVEPVVGRELMLSSLGLTTEDSSSRAEVERELMSDQAKLTTLLKHYGEAHPKVAETMQEIESAQQYLADFDRKVKERLNALDNERLAPMMLGTLEEQLASLWRHESKLTEEYAQAELKAVQVNDRMAELHVAEHEIARLQSLHDTLLNRIANIDIGQNHSGVQVTVVSDAEASHSPVSPRRLVLALLCLVGGTGLGVAMVYILDVLDDRFRSPEELQEQIGAPMLAMIWEMKGQSGSGPDALQVHTSPESTESEAFRTLRTTLAFSGQDTERLAVTSAEPSDGKTTVLANLGVSYAQAGKRTLLVDADLRRPGLTKLFNLRGKPGLSEILRSEDDLASMCLARVHSTSCGKLDVIPCGPKPSNPAELLSDYRLAEVMAWAEANYDQVLIDCPPILAASDAAIVGRQTDGLMLVVQPEKNHRRLVLRAVAGLTSIGVTVLGVVANRISRDHKSDYYGYSGYGYGYGESSDDYVEEEFVAAEEQAAAA